MLKSIIGKILGIIGQSLQLADCGLIGKLHMTSVMEDVTREIKSIL